MGGKLTKKKTPIMTGKTEEQQGDTNTATVEKTTNHLDQLANDDGKQTGKKKNKKKKEEKLNKKSAKVKVDKNINKDNCVLPPSSFAEHLVGEQVSSVNNPVPSAIEVTQTNVVDLSESANTDVHELRSTLVQNGIVSSVSHSDNQQNADENHHQTNNLNIDQDAVYDIPATVITKVEVIRYQEE